MSHEVLLHPDVERYLDSLSKTERKRCYNGLKKLMDDPLKSRSGCDIRKMIGRKPHYRLRVGDHRFLYVIQEDEGLVEEAFRRGKEYR